MKPIAILLSAVLLLVGCGSIRASAGSNPSPATVLDYYETEGGRQFWRVSLDGQECIVAEGYGGGDASGGLSCDWSE